MITAEASHLESQNEKKTKFRLKRSFVENSFFTK